MAYLKLCVRGQKRDKKIKWQGQEGSEQLKATVHGNTSGKQPLRNLKDAKKERMVNKRQTKKDDAEKNEKRPQKEVKGNFRFL